MVMVPSIRDLDRSSKLDVWTRPLDPTLGVFTHLVTTVVAADAVAGGSFQIFSFVLLTRELNDENDS